MTLTSGDSDLDLGHKQIDDVPHRGAESEKKLDILGSTSYIVISMSQSQETKTAV
jgi:hypothetical protein